ncbi:MAG TPA: universal stress protein [Gaiellaceae bacterium]|nr:universal stress protein [Gaiellaceae bacterium]
MNAKAAPTFTPVDANDYRERAGNENGAPIVAAIDGSFASRAAVEAAVQLGAELNAPVVFVHVRRGPAGFLGTPVYEQRLTKTMARARNVLDGALELAAEAGVPAEGEILEGTPQRRIPEFAHDRGARLVIVGSRERKLGRSVSRAIARVTERPVVVARRPYGLALAR